MDHDNCPMTLLKALLNIIGGKGAISNINYYHIKSIKDPDNKVKSKSYAFDCDRATVSVYQAYKNHPAMTCRFYWRNSQDILL